MPLTRSQAKMETDKLMELLLRRFEEQEQKQEERDRKQREEQEERDRKQEERDRKQEERDRKQREEQEERDRRHREEQEERDRKQREEQEERERRNREEQKELINTIKEDLKKENENRDKRQEELLIKFKSDLEKQQEDRVKLLREDLEKNLTSFEATVEEELGQVQRKMQELEMKFKRAPIHTEVGTSVSMKVKPPKFDGKVAWSTYLNQFEAAAQGNCWNEEEKAINLKLCLRGEATEILRMVPSERQLNYEALISTLEMRYGEAHLQQVYQAQLKTRRQQPEESLQQFEADVARLVNLAYPSAPATFREQISVNSFIDGVRDPDTNHALRMAHHKNISEALAHGLEYEAAFQATRRQSRVRQVKSSDIDLEERLKRIETLLTRKSSAPKKPLRCWNCDKEGHFKHQCPKLLTRNQENSQ